MVGVLQLAVVDPAVQEVEDGVRHQAEDVLHQRPHLGVTRLAVGVDGRGQLAPFAACGGANGGASAGVSPEVSSERKLRKGKAPTLAEVDEGGQRLQPHLGVVHPDQEPPQGQAVLGASGRALLVLHLQLQRDRKWLQWSPTSHKIIPGFVLSCFCSSVFVYFILFSLMMVCFLAVKIIKCLE